MEAEELGCAHVVEFWWVVNVNMAADAVMGSNLVEHTSCSLVVHRVARSLCTVNSASKSHWELGCQDADSSCTEELETGCHSYSCCNDLVRKANERDEDVEEHMTDDFVLHVVDQDGWNSASDPAAFVLLLSSED